MNINQCPWAVYCEDPPSFIWGEWGRGKKNWGTLLFQSTVDIHIQNSKNHTKKALKHHNFEQSVGDHRQKCKNNSEKIQDQRLDQKFATSERKQQEKWQIIQIFRDNFPV